MKHITDYRLQNVANSREFEDDAWLLSDPQYAKPSLIRAIYGKKQLDVKDDSYGFYKYMDWLPLNRTLKGSSAPVTYKSEGISKCLGLDNLYITFSGYWPEKGAGMTSCSFKETEAYSVCGRLSEDNDRILTVASAGNTARAFAKVCSENNIPLLVVIPEENMDAMWFENPLNSCVKIIAVPKGCDYFDAIHLGSIVCKSKMFLEEGGAKNVARRDGMGTTVLSAATTIGRIPDVYVQAVGSGTGTIAAWEAAMRLEEDGRFGKNTMRLIAAQNDPFIPMYESWKKDSRDISFDDEAEARRLALRIDAKVLSNRKPPYGITGGLFDALKTTSGNMYFATNEELAKGCEIFEKYEGIDIHPAAGVAVTALVKAVKEGDVKKDDIVMLNITGGGEKRFKSDFKVCMAKADLVINPNETAESEIIAKVEALYK